MDEFFCLVSAFKKCFLIITLAKNVLTYCGIRIKKKGNNLWQEGTLSGVFWFAPKSGKKPDHGGHAGLIRLV